MNDPHIPPLLARLGLNTGGGAAATGEDAAVAVAAEVPLHIPELLELNDSDLSAEVLFELLARPLHRQRLSR